MKRTLTFLVVLMLAFAITATAQEKTTRLGVKAGVNLTSFTGDDADGFESLVGFAFGGFISHSLSENIAIQPEVLFSMKGAKTEIGDIDLKYNYIEIPVLLKYTLPTDGLLKPMFFAGPSFGILMSAEADGEDFKDDSKSTDLSIVVGAGLQIEALSFDIRYTMGMTELDDTETLCIKHSNFSLMVGFAF